MLRRIMDDFCLFFLFSYVISSLLELKVKEKTSSVIQ